MNQGLRQANLNLDKPTHTPSALQCGYSADDVYLHAAPLFHIGGLCSALAMLAAGARHVFLPRFDGPALLAAVRQHGVTAFIAGASCPLPVAPCCRACHAWLPPSAATCQLPTQPCAPSAHHPCSAHHGG